MRNVIFLLMVLGSTFSLLAQVANDLCGNAADLCPGVLTSVTNANANASVCTNCEDDFNFCFNPEATIWYAFNTNALGGDLTVDITNVIFQSNPGQDQEMQAAIIAAGAPCDASTYTLVGSCSVSGASTQMLTATGLNPNSTYFLVLGGDQNGPGITTVASFSADVLLSGPGVDRNSPVLGISQSNAFPCKNENVTFTATVTDCPDSSDYRWYVNGILSATTVDNFWVSGGFQTGDVVHVEIDCYADCPITMTASGAALDVYSFPLDAGVDLSISSGTSAQLSGATTASNFSWSPSFEVSNPNVLNPIVSPSETTVFSLTAEENGCIQTDQITVFILQDLLVPNTISPNDDNQNDLWIIPGIENYPNNSVSLFSRWGQEIFTLSSYSANKAWDGTTRSGSKAAEGVYYYIIDLGDGSDLLKGTLNLIR